MDRKERRVRGEDLVFGSEERPRGDVFPLDSAVRQEHVEALETEILLDRLRETGHSCLPWIEVEFAFVEALSDRVQDGGMHREGVRVLRHPRHLLAVLV